MPISQNTYTVPNNFVQQYDLGQKKIRADLVDENFTDAAGAINTLLTDDANTVHLTGAETISGAKTFSGNNTYTGTSTFTGDITVTNLTATGNVSLPATTTGVTASSGDNSTKIATTAYADAAATAAKATSMLCNVRTVLTTSGTWTAPVTGWYKVTCIGGGGAGGNGGITGTYGGLSGTQGGTTSFGSLVSANGGHSGAGGGRTSGGGGGAAGEVITEYKYIISGTQISYTIGAGGVAPTSGYMSSSTGQDGSGGAKGGILYHGGQGAISVFGSGNTGSPYHNTDPSYGSMPTGIGGSNGTPYGGGGSGGITSHCIVPTYASVGGANGEPGATITTLDSTYPKGGDGGPGAIILEYYNPAVTA